MKKTFIKVSLIGLLAVSMPFSFSSCKDYDDDIAAVNKKTDGLSSQLAALEAALANAQSAAAAAQQSADEATKAADEAKAEAQKAIVAAETAKAEAIEAALAKVNELMSGYASAGDLSKLAGTVEGIQKGLNELTEDLKALDADVDQNSRAITAINTQIAALEKFELATNQDLTALKNDLAGLKSQLATKVSEEDVNKLLNAAKEDITKQIGSAVADAISTLKNVLSNRLTSVTLVPDLYVDGIETIEFVSLQYQPKKQGSTGLVGAGSTIIVSSEENPAHYRLNPITTDLSDIDADNIEFVAYRATSRGVVSSPIAYVKGSAEIAQSGLEKGIMTVRAKKTITSTLNGSGQIYTVALKVPIAKDLCADPNVSEFVYSEYSRLSESMLTPEIAEKNYNCKPSSHKHYSDSVTIWGSNVANDELVTKEVLYNETLDIATLVTGCAKEDARELTAKELAKYGLEFRYAIPSKAYTTGAENGTDQQQFISIKGSVVSSKTPSGLTNNKAVVGKQPIVRVTLVDVVNNKIVDQRYLKIKWTEKKLDAVDLEEKTFDRKLGCGSIEVKVTWEDFIEIYAKVQGDKLDMSKDQFTLVYLSDENNKYEVVKHNYNMKEGAITTDPDNSADAAVLYWELTPEEIGKIIKFNTAIVPHKDGVELVNNVFTATVSFKPNNNDYPVINLPLKMTITLPEVPYINGFYDNYWSVPHTEYAVYPVQYGTPAQAQLGNETCVFHNNVMNAFTFGSTGFIVNGLSSCGTWDMQFCKDHNEAGYAPKYAGNEPDLNKAQDIDGYNLFKGNVEVAQLVWDEGHSAWCGNSAHKQAYIELHKVDEGRALLNKNSHLGVWAKINEFNVWPVWDFDIKFVEPLNIKTAVIEDAFVDGVISGSRIDWTKTFKMYDCFGYSVAKVTTNPSQEKTKYAAELYKYYEVQEPKWDTVNIKFGMKEVNGTIVVDNTLTESQAMTATKLASLTTGGSIPSLKQEGEELVFYSNMGSQVADFFYIWIPVTVEYGWGEVTTSVKVKVNAMNNTPVE